MLSVFAHSGAPAAAIERVTSSIVSKSRASPLSCASRLSSPFQIERILSAGHRRLAKKFVDELMREVGCPVVALENLAIACGGPVRPTPAAPTSPQREFVWRRRRIRAGSFASILDRECVRDHRCKQRGFVARVVANAHHVFPPNRPPSWRRFQPARLISFANASHRALTSLWQHGVGNDGGRVTPAFVVLFPDRRAIQQDRSDQRFRGSFAERHERPELLSLGAAADRVACVGIVDKSVRQFDGALSGAPPVRRSICRPFGNTFAQPVTPCVGAPP